MATLKKLTGQELNAPTLFAADILANPSPRQAKEKARTTPVTYGLGLENVLAFLDPVTQSWKMYEATCLLGELRSLEKLPISGIALSGVLYQRPAWEQITDASGSLCWPTPTTQEVEHPDAQWTETNRRISKNGANTTHGMGLADAVQKWPTPQAHDAKHLTSKPKPTGQKMLSTHIYERDASTSGGKLNPTFVEWLMGFPLGWTDLED